MPRQSSSLAFLRLKTFLSTWSVISEKELALKCIREHNRPSKIIHGVEVPSIHGVNAQEKIYLSPGEPLVVKLQEIDQKIEELKLRIKAEGSQWFRSDANVMTRLIQELEKAIVRREEILEHSEVLSRGVELLDRVEELDSSLQRANSTAKEQIGEAVKAGGIGFGGAAAIASYCDLSSNWTSVALAVGTTAGLFFQNLLCSKNPDSKLTKT